MVEFNVEIERLDSLAIVRSDGYINNLGGEKIANECYRLIDTGCSSFLLNLEKSKVVNSIGISILIELIERILETNGKLAFTNLTPTVAKTFKIMGLLQYADLYNEESSAISALKGK
jgi:anti-anti-sigma factor